MTTPALNSTPMSIELALTVTIKPKYYRMSCKEQFMETFQLLLSWLKPFKHTTVAEFTPQGNVHYHGVIQIPMHLLKNKLPKYYLIDYFRGSSTFGYVCVKPITNHDGWIKTYVAKHLDETKQVLGCTPIIKDDFDDFMEEENIEDFEKSRLIQMTQQARDIKRMRMYLEQLDKEHLKNKRDSEHLDWCYQNVLNNYKSLDPDVVSL